MFTYGTTKLHESDKTRQHINKTVKKVSEKLAIGNGQMEIRTMSPSIPLSKEVQSLLILGIFHAPILCEQTRVDQR